MKVFIDTRDFYGNELSASINALCEKLPKFFNGPTDTVAVENVCKIIKNRLYSRVVERIVPVTIDENFKDAEVQFSAFINDAADSIAEALDCPCPDTDGSKLAVIPTSQDILLPRCVPHDEILYVTYNYELVLLEIKSWAENTSKAMAEKFIETFKPWANYKCD